MSIYFQDFPTIQYDLYNDKHTMEMVDLFRTVKPKAKLKDDILLYSFYTIQDGERPDHVSQKLYSSPNYYWTFFMVNETLVNLYTDWPLSTYELQMMTELKYDGYVLTTDDDISTVFKKDEIIQGLVSGARAKIVEKDTNRDTIRIKELVGEFVADELVLGLTSGDSITITGQTEYYNATHHYEDPDGLKVDKNNIDAIPVTNWEYEKLKNEEKAKIRVIRPSYIARVAEEFFKQIKPPIE